MAEDNKGNLENKMYSGFTIAPKVMSPDYASVNLEFSAEKLTENTVHEALQELIRYLQVIRKKTVKVLIDCKKAEEVEKDATLRLAYVVYKESEGNTLAKLLDGEKIKFKINLPKRERARLGKFIRKFRRYSKEKFNYDDVRYLREAATEVKSQYSSPETSDTKKLYKRIFRKLLEKPKYGDVPEEEKEEFIENLEADKKKCELLEGLLSRLHRLSHPKQEAEIKNIFAESCEQFIKSVSSLPKLKAN